MVSVVDDSDNYTGRLPRSPKSVVSWLSIIDTTTTTLVGGVIGTELNDKEETNHKLARRGQAAGPAANRTTTIYREPEGGHGPSLKTNTPDVPRRDERRKGDS